MHSVTAVTILISGTHNKHPGLFSSLLSLFLQIAQVVLILRSTISLVGCSIQIHTWWRGYSHSISLGRVLISFFTSLRGGSLDWSGNRTVIARIA